MGKRRRWRVCVVAVPPSTKRMFQAVWSSVVYRGSGVLIGLSIDEAASTVEGLWRWVAGRASGGRAAVAAGVCGMVAVIRVVVLWPR